jgi:hypothetical protein
MQPHQLNLGSPRLHSGTPHPACLFHALLPVAAKSPYLHLAGKTELASSAQLKKPLNTETHHKAALH